MNDHYIKTPGCSWCYPDNSGNQFICGNCVDGFNSDFNRNTSESERLGYFHDWNAQKLHSRYDEEKNQPNPIPNESTPIVDLVIEDMKKRKELGIQRYGVALQAHNGRNSMRDAYEEALDLAIYLKQCLEEQNNE